MSIFMAKETVILSGNPSTWLEVDCEPYALITSLVPGDCAPTVPAMRFLALCRMVSSGSGHLLPSANCLSIISPTPGVYPFAATLQLMISPLVDLDLHSTGDPFTCPIPNCAGHRAFA